MGYTATTGLLTAAIVAVLLVGYGITVDGSADAALQRTRKQIEIFDGIYKGGIVLITDNYVTEESDMPAGVAFKELFATAEGERLARGSTARPYRRAVQR